MNLTSNGKYFGKCFKGVRLSNNGIITVCAAIVYDKNSILVIQEAKKIAYAKYNIPGGHIEPNEDICNTVIREVKEETNLDIELEGFVGIYPHQISDGSTVIKLIFSAKPINYNIKYPIDEILNAFWMELNDFQNLKKRELRSNDLNKIISDYQKKGIVSLGIVNSIAL